MKKLLAFSSIAMIAMSVFSGCSKSSSGSSYFMKETIAGKSYSSTYCAAGSSSGYVTIAGSSGTSLTYPYVTLTLANYNKTTGTFTLDTTLTGSFAEYNKDASTVVLAKSGSVTITSASPNIVGTFSFTCTDGTVVSGGSFTAKSY